MTSVVGANTAFQGAKVATKFGNTVSRVALVKSLVVDQSPNGVILSGGGLIPGPVGGGFSLASLFFDLQPLVSCQP